MKATLLFLAIFCSGFTAAFATIHVIRVSNYQFTPKTVNAIVGDTVVWIWSEGTHTTTSTMLPAGVKPWDSPITSSQKRFGIRVTEAGIYKFKCTPHASSGMRGTINVSPSLVAELFSFEVTPLSDNADISWKTRQDNDIAYYNIKRSINNDDFSIIAQIEPGKTDAAVKLYNYVDENKEIQSKYIYYMIEMVDTKGNKQLSEIKMFSNAISAPKLITSLSPNPVSSSGHLMLQFNADDEGKMRVQLFDVSGQLVRQTDMSAVKGLNNGHFHLQDLKPGTYYLECRLGERYEKHTILVK